MLATNAQDVEEVLSTAALAGMCLEINTSGLRRSQRLTYPAPELRPLAAVYGVPVITGSDAHEPHLVGNASAEVPDLRQARFHGRRFEILPLASSRAIAS